MNPFKWVLNWFNASRRQMDVDILWPICKEHGGNLDHAKAAFAVHAFNDSAWICMGHDWVFNFINNLE